MIGAEFWEMGGYAAFVWPAYGVSLGVLLVFAIVSYRRKKTLEKQASEISKKDKG